MGNPPFVIGWIRCKKPAAISDAVKWWISHCNVSLPKGNNSSESSHWVSKEKTTHLTRRIEIFPEVPLIGWSGVQPRNREFAAYEIFSRWGFLRFFMFTTIWGWFPFWLIFFRWAETTWNFMKHRQALRTGLVFSISRSPQAIFA